MCTCNDPERAVIAAGIVDRIVMAANEHSRGTYAGSAALSTFTVRAAVYIADRINPSPQSCPLHPLPYLHTGIIRT